MHRRGTSLSGSYSAVRLEPEDQYSFQRNGESSSAAGSTSAWSTPKGSPTTVTAGLPEDTTTPGRFPSGRHTRSVSASSSGYRPMAQIGPHHQLERRRESPLMSPWLEEDPSQPTLMARRSISQSSPLDAYQARSKAQLYDLRSNSSSISIDTLKSSDLARSSSRVPSYGSRKTSGLPQAWITAETSADTRIYKLPLLSDGDARKKRAKFVFLLVVAVGAVVTLVVLGTSRYGTGGVKSALKSADEWIQAKTGWRPSNALYGSKEEASWYGPIIGTKALDRIQRVDLTQTSDLRLWIDHSTLQTRFHLGQSLHFGVDPVEALIDIKLIHHGSEADQAIPAVVPMPHGAWKFTHLPSPAPQPEEMIEKGIEPAEWTLPMTLPGRFELSLQPSPGARNDSLQPMRGPSKIWAFVVGGGAGIFDPAMERPSCGGTAHDLLGVWSAYPSDNESSASFHSYSGCRVSGNLRIEPFSPSKPTQKTWKLFHKGPAGRWLYPGHVSGVRRRAPIRWIRLIGSGEGEVAAALRALERDGAHCTYLTDRAACSVARPDDGTLVVSWEDWHMGPSTLPLKMLIAANFNDVLPFAVALLDGRSEVVRPDYCFVSLGNMNPDVDQSRAEATAAQLHDALMGGARQAVHNVYPEHLGFFTTTAFLSSAQSDERRFARKRNLVIAQVLARLGLMRAAGATVKAGDGRRADRHFSPPLPKAFSNVVKLGMTAGAKASVLDRLALVEGRAAPGAGAALATQGPAGGTEKSSPIPVRNLVRSHVINTHELFSGLATRLSPSILQGETIGRALMHVILATISEAEADMIDSGW